MITWRRGCSTITDPSLLCGVQGMRLSFAVCFLIPEVCQRHSHTRAATWESGDPFGEVNLGELLLCYWEDTLFGGYPHAYGSYISQRNRDFHYTVTAIKVSPALKPPTCSYMHAEHGSMVHEQWSSEDVQYGWGQKGRDESVCGDQALSTMGQGPVEKARTIQGEIKK